MLEDGDVEMIAIYPLKSIVLILLLITGSRVVAKCITHVPDAVAVESRYEFIGLAESVSLQHFHNHIEHSLLDYHPHHFFLLRIGDVHEGI